MIPAAGLRASWPGPDAVLFPALGAIQSRQPSLLPTLWAGAVFPGVKYVPVKNQTDMQGAILFLCEGFKLYFAFFFKKDIPA